VVRVVAESALLAIEASSLRVIVQTRLALANGMLCGTNRWAILLTHLIVLVFSLLGHVREQR
jgi:hypothetical protein